MSHLLAMYLGAGLFGGVLMAIAIPALNGFGVVYYMLTWPAHVYCAPAERECSAVPEPEHAAWMFTLE